MSHPLYARVLADHFTSASRSGSARRGARDIDLDVARARHDDRWIRRGAPARPTTRH